MYIPLSSFDSKSLFQVFLYNEGGENFIALISSVYVRPGDEENVFIGTRWFYRWSDILEDSDRSPYEIFWSAHEDENPAESVLGWCDVKFLIGPQGIKELLARKVLIPSPSLVFFSSIYIFSSLSPFTLSFVETIPQGPAVLLLLIL
jgi:hypothetical protein